ncbi:SMP-30/gluconolactonase/LRE family protein [Pelagimonas varians]|uniref:SMP-30/gluconolactonase/LRE family protein n=1 Tax=Pelagimonas varians TaxID=696760 RepID=UPI000DA11903
MIKDQCSIFHEKPDIETGAVSNRRTFAKVDGSNGGEDDGSTVGAEGYLWTAHISPYKLTFVLSAAFVALGSFDTFAACCTNGG